MEITSRPVPSRRYIKIKKNPSKTFNRDAYVRKYVREDPIRTRGQLLKKYRLSEEDLIEIEKWLIKNKKVSVKPTKLGLGADYSGNTNVFI